MIFACTFLLVIFLFFANYNLNNKELSSPSVVFSASFVGLLFFDLVNYTDLGLNTLSWRTGMVLVVGIISFSIGTMPFLTKCNKVGKDAIINRYVCLNKKVNSQKLFAFLVFEVIILLLTAKQLGLFSGNIGVILGGIRNSTVNNGSGILPKYLAICNMITLMGGVFFSVEMPKFLKEKKIKEAILCILGFIASILITFSGGSRGSAIILIFSLLCNYLIEYYKKYNWKKEFKASTILKIMGIFLVLLIAFKEISLLMGQTQVADLSLTRYTLIYIGAQLKNLDMAITSRNIIGTSEVFGQETFRAFVNFFSNLVGSGKYSSYDLYLPFNRYNDISLGNVYTTFYAYLRDFGYFGVIFCPMLMGFLSEFMYYKVKAFSKRNDGVSIWHILWSYSFFCLAFSFFSNKFYENIFTLNIINYIFASFIVLIYFFGVPIAKNWRLRRNLW